MTARVLVAGIGNVFFGDDGFGVEVLSRLDTSAMPRGVDVRDYGIKSVHLAYDLLDGEYDTLILVDAAPLGEAPGTLAVLDLGTEPARISEANVDAHSMTPQSVLAALQAIGGRVARTLVVGCQPAAFGQGMELSAPVQAALPAAVSLVLETAAAEAARERVDSLA